MKPWESSDGQIAVEIMMSRLFSGCVQCCYSFVEFCQCQKNTSDNTECIHVFTSDTTPFTYKSLLSVQLRQKLINKMSMVQNVLVSYMCVLQGLDLVVWRFIMSTSSFMQNMCLFPCVFNFQPIAVTQTSLQRALRRSDAPLTFNVKTFLALLKPWINAHMDCYMENFSSVHRFFLLSVLMHWEIDLK